MSKKIYLVYFLFVTKFILRTNYLQKREEIEVLPNYALLNVLALVFLCKITSNYNNHIDLYNIKKKQNMLKYTLLQVTSTYPL